MSALRALTTLLGLSLTASALVALPAAATPTGSASVTDAVSVSIPLGTVDTPGKSGQNAILRIKVGESTSIRVMVDTGITGLLLWGEAPRGAQNLDIDFETRLAGTNLRGVIARAPLTIGGVTTTRDITFAQVSTDNRYIQRWKRLGISGIIGLSTSPGTLTNPLMSMPGELGRGWSLQFQRRVTDQPARFGALILGAQAPPDAAMHFTLPTAGVDANGSAVWDDHAADGCWQFADGGERCVPTWFDSGFTLMRVKGRVFADLPTTPAQRLRRGTLVELAAGSSAYFGYRFLAGKDGSRNLVKVIPRGAAVINTGNGIYFDYTVTYRVDTGDVYLDEKGLA